MAAAALLLRRAADVARLVAPLAGLWLALAPVPLLCGAAPGALARYLLYAFVYQLVPGTLLYRVLRGGAPARGAAIAGWALGFCLETVLYDLTAQARLARLFPWFPLAVVAAWAACTLRRGERRPEAGAASGLWWPPFLAAAALCAVLVAADAFTPVVNFHLAEQALIANAVAAGPPYGFPMIDGMPLYYNYLVHAHVAAASAATGVGALELSVRGVPFLLLLLCLATLQLAAERHYASRWVGLLVILQAFGVVGAEHLQGRWLGSSMPHASVFSFSILASYAAFFALVAELADLDGAADRRGRRLTLALLIWAAAGLRMPALACFGAGAAAAALGAFWRGRPWRGWAGLAAAVGLAGAAGLVYFYGALSPFAAPKFMELAWTPARSLAALPAVSSLEGLGLPPYAAGLAAFLLVLIGQTTFLAVGLIGARPWLGRHPLDLFWLGAAGFGAAVTYFTHAPGGSHFTFMHYAHLGLAVLGARGVVALAASARHEGRSLLPALASVWLLAAFQAGEALAGAAASPTWEALGRRPVLLEGDDYAALIGHLRATHEPACRYVVDGTFSAWRTPSNALPAEVPGLRLLGTRDKLGYYLDRHRDAELERRLAFLEAVWDEVRGGRPSAEGFGALQRRFGIEGCLVVVVGFRSPEELARAHGWQFRAGRFVVFRPAPAARAPLTAPSGLRKIEPPQRPAPRLHGGGRVSTEES